MTRDAHDTLRARYDLWIDSALAIISRDFLLSSHTSLVISVKNQNGSASGLAWSMSAEERRIKEKKIIGGSGSLYVCVCMYLLLFRFKL